jgi:hypothetical protein
MKENSQEIVRKKFQSSLTLQEQAAISGEHDEKNRRYTLTLNCCTYNEKQCFST